MSFIVTRAPFRVSFAGGGTDLPSFYQNGHGTVLSTAINKYVYVIINQCRPLLHKGVDDSARYRIRLSYSSTENVQRADELQHPIVRAALKHLDLDIPLDIATMADVPAGTGLGSSGTFTVVLLHALHTVKGEEVTQEQLAAEAAHIEIDILGRPIGKQDHYAAAYGGLNMIQFHSNQEVTINQVGSPHQIRDQLFPSLLLLYTGMSRDAGSVLAEQQANTQRFYQDLLSMRGHAEQLRELLESELSIQRFGEVLHSTWMHKRKLAASITNSAIDRWYDMAIEAGALGGKICGAGGGGFLLLVVESGLRGDVRRALEELEELPIDYEPNGSMLLPVGE